METNLESMYRIEDIEVIDNHLHLRGFAFNTRLIIGESEYVGLFFLDQNLQKQQFTISRIFRPDIKRLYNIQLDDSGFDARFDLSVMEHLKNPELFISFRDGTEIKEKVIIEDSLFKQIMNEGNSDRLSPTLLNGQKYIFEKVRMKQRNVLLNHIDKRITDIIEVNPTDLKFEKIRLLKENVKVVNNKKIELKFSSHRVNNRWLVIKKRDGSIVDQLKISDSKVSINLPVNIIKTIFWELYITDLEGNETKIQTKKLFNVSKLRNNYKLFFKLPFIKKVEGELGWYVIYYLIKEGKR